jgi:hypothetical protein
MVLRKRDAAEISCERVSVGMALSDTDDLLGPLYV